VLINFFFTLRAAKVPVSVREYLTLLEALKAGVIDDDTGPTLDKFYYLSRTALVKDEAHFDKFDRAFSAYFEGVEMLTDFTQEVPLEWLRKTLELELSPEEKAAIEKMGWDELMETLKKRFEEQKERHQGVPLGPMATTPRASASGRPKDATAAPSKCGTNGPTKTMTTPRSWAPATSKWRCAVCAALHGKARPRNWTWMTPFTPQPPTQGFWISRWCLSVTTK
jgi:uncharacterized protein with von Willebrand factor type A (vWA) domain